jgi:hypothetical protein
MCGYEILVQVTVGSWYLFTLTVVLTGRLKSWDDVRNLCMLLYAWNCVSDSLVHAIPKVGKPHGSIDG